jgi:2-polyprenyl-6-methoxyphenol hydroxylase-like FAD-dependent oxidoreductase
MVGAVGAVGTKERRAGHAVVVGASMGGLLTARVLADRFERVTVLERDALPTDAQSRKGVPQGRHAHGLLAAGERVLRDLFPGLMEELIEGGAFRGGQLADARWWQFDGYRLRDADDVDGTLLSRPYLEDGVRRRVLALDNVVVRDGVSVLGLVARDGRVVGLDIDDGNGARTLDADFVVDCAGRGSRATRWLTDLGYDAPKVSQVKIDMGYASRTYRRVPDATRDWAYAVSIQTPPAGKRLGVMFPIEDDRWMVTLCGFFGDHAPTDDDGFLSFARTLPTGEIAHVVATAEPLTPAVTHRLPSNQWRHYEKLARVPAAFVALGDSICSFNPIYGQGMTSAALQAVALGACLDRDGVTSPRVPKRFYRAAKKVVSIPWQIAAGADFIFAETTGPKPPMTDAVNRYIRKVFVAAQYDPVVARALVEMMNLLAPPPSLMRPAIYRRVRAAVKRGPAGTRNAAAPLAA